jgi:hypothetical protein
MEPGSMLAAEPVVAGVANGELVVEPAFMPRRGSSEAVRRAKVDISKVLVVI